MKVILRKDFDQLGKLGDILDVKDGYARNYLFPRQIAYPATGSYLKMFEEEKKQHARRSEKKRHSSELLAKELSGITLTIPMKVGEEDRLFGSVTSQVIGEALEGKSITLDRRSIELSEPIKSLGEFTVPVKLEGGVNASVKVYVVKE